MSSNMFDGWGRVLVNPDPTKVAGDWSLSKQGLDSCLVGNQGNVFQRNRERRQIHGFYMFTLYASFQNAYHIRGTC